MDKLTLKNVRYSDKSNIDIQYSDDYCKVGIQVTDTGYRLRDNRQSDKLIWIANFYLFGIQTVAKWMVLTIQLATMVKGLVTKCHSLPNF